MRFGLLFFYVGSRHSLLRSCGSVYDQKALLHLVQVSSDARVAMKAVARFLQSFVTATIDLS